MFGSQYDILVEATGLAAKCPSVIKKLPIAFKWTCEQVSISQ